MQGPRGNIGSLPETLDFDHGSASSNAAIRQQICWNNLRNNAEDWLPDFMLQQGDTHNSQRNPAGHEGHNLGEPSSSDSQTEFCRSEFEGEHGGSSSLSALLGADPRLEDPSEPTNCFSMDNNSFNFCSNDIANGPILLQSPHSDFSAQNIDTNATLPAYGGNDRRLIECPTLHTSNESLDGMIPSASSSPGPYRSHPRNGRHLVEENKARTDRSLHGRHAFCKRKAVEGVVGQPSEAGSSTFQHAESSAWRAVSARNNGDRSLATASDNILGIGSSDQLFMRPGIVVGEVSPDDLPSISVPGNAENFQRNVRARVTPSDQQYPVPSNFLSRGSNYGCLEISSRGPSPSRPPVNHSPGVGSAHSGDNTSSQNQSFLVNIPPLPCNGHSFRWNEASSSRPSNSSSPVMSGDRNSMLHEDSNPRNIAINIAEHPMFMPTTELRNTGQTSTNWNLTGGNTSFRGNTVSASRSISHAGPSTSSQELESPSTFGNQGSHPSYTHTDGIPEFPYSLRNLSSGREGRRRLVSEIRNALDIARRAEGLRFEDHFMMFDHPAFLRAADAHDRHRDMRLDIDLMSYEELLALEERIGNVSTGLSEETILSRMKEHEHSRTLLETEVDAEPCCICREDYCEGEELGMLDCGHEFHTGCIKQWLMHKNLCPICKTTGLKIP